MDNKVLMRKGNMVHYAPYDAVDDFLSCGWVKADLTVKECKKNIAKETTKRKTKKSN